MSGSVKDETGHLEFLEQVTLSLWLLYSQAYEVGLNINTSHHPVLLPSVLVYSLILQTHAFPSGLRDQQM